MAPIMEWTLIMTVGSQSSGAHILYIRITQNKSFSLCDVFFFFVGSHLGFQNSISEIKESKWVKTYIDMVKNFRPIVLIGFTIRLLTCKIHYLLACLYSNYILLKTFWWQKFIIGYIFSNICLKNECKYRKWGVKHKIILLSGDIPPHIKH